jgi:hypothetical protein
MNYILGSIVALALVFATNFTSYVSNLDNKEVQGSVSVGNEYQATTTNSTWSTAVNQCKDTLAGDAPYKTLGSVIVTKTSNATLTITDATSTTHTDFATSTIASFPLTTVGTYTFDVKLKRGLCVQVDTSVGVASTTITFRP